MKKLSRLSGIASRILGRSTTTATAIKGGCAIQLASAPEAEDVFRPHEAARKLASPAASQQIVVTVDCALLRGRTYIARSKKKFVLPVSITPTQYVAVPERQVRAHISPDSGINNRTGP